MSKKKFASPFVVLGGLIVEDPEEPGDDVVIGGGTGQNTTDVVWSYDDWNKFAFEDINGDDLIDEKDYYLWFLAKCGGEFDSDLWEFLNPGMPVPGA